MKVLVATGLIVYAVSLAQGVLTGAGKGGRGELEGLEGIGYAVGYQIGNMVGEALFLILVVVLLGAGAKMLGQVISALREPLSPSPHNEGLAAARS